MDEYANEKGETAPTDWEGSFATSMRQSFFAKIDADLRPADRNIHFPTDRNIDSYWKMIEDAGGADCCYGGIGWCGHIAFWESHLGLEFAGDLHAYKQAHGRIVELNPMTIMQNALQLALVKHYVHVWSQMQFSPRALRRFFVRRKPQPTDGSPAP
jgi:glucosamine-6-phosphate deaminase